MKENNYELNQVKVKLKLSDATPLYSDRPIDTPDAAINVMRKALAEMDREYACVVNLDAKNRPINFNVVSIGTANKTEFSMSNLFKSAILSNASSVMMFHNHPSGDLTPSRFDLIATSKLIEAGKLLDIKVLDHVIVAGGTGQYYSMNTNHKGMFREDLQINPTGQEPTVQLAEAKKSFVNIMEYAKSKNVDVHVINGYISAHRKDFIGHIAKVKKGAALDDFARSKVEEYLENRPQKGNRFRMYESQMMQLQQNQMKEKQIKEQEDVGYGEVVIDSDVPDYGDGADDRVSISLTSPSKKNKNRKITGNHNYKVPKKKIENQTSKIKDESSIEMKNESKPPEVKPIERKAPVKDDFEMER